jgi:hypothetical protein
MRQGLREELKFARRFASEGWRALGSVASPEGRGITLSLTKQSLADYEGIILLASQGCADQCLMLWRPMFEKMLVSQWALLHPQRASKRFAEQHRHSLLMTNRIAKEMPELAYGQLPFPEAEPGEEEALNREFGKWGERGVTGRRVHQLVEDICATLSEADADDLRHCHRTAYFQSNDVLHTTSHAFGSTHSPFLEDLAGERFESMECRQVLRYGWQTSMRMLRSVSDLFDSGCWASLAELEREGLELFNTAIAEQMERLNRAANLRLQLDRYIEYGRANRSRLATVPAYDTCPCGSGKTYGECHRPIDAALARWADVPKFGDDMLLRP